MKQLRNLLAFVIFFVCINAQALTQTEEFTTSRHLDSSGGAVWNIALGEIHPPLLVIGWDSGSGLTNTSFDVGDGQHGAFNTSTYSSFDTDGAISGGIIEINTNSFSNLEFTTFHLAAGYTLRPTGSQPLVIRSQSDVVIDGQLDCSGSSGENAVVAVSTSVSGGAGRCGGGDGGASAPAGVAPGVAHQGEAGGASVSGGFGGPICLATGGQGGGGGGSYIKAYSVIGDKPDPTAGDNSSGGPGGAAGSIFQNDEFSILAGAGSGGGGGSAYDNGADPAAHSSGAGGGAGGGNIQIYVARDLTVAATGSITVDGGAGGSVLGGDKGGAGGGGAGGSILIFAGRDIVNDGAITAAAGVGGTTAGGVGGDGSWGRTWLVEKDGFAGGTNIEDPDTELLLPGDVRYETGVTYTVTSTAIDMLNSHPTFTQLPISLTNVGASVLSYDLATSAQSDLAGLSIFLPSTSFLNLESERYMRFQIQFDNTNALTPIRIQSVGFTYTGFEQTEFDFVTGCGRVGPASPPSGGLVLLLLPLVLFFLLRLTNYGRCARQSSGETPKADLYQKIS